MLLSKSKLMAWRQCPKRLWLEVHRPALREDSAMARAAFEAGHAVGAVARRLYDPQGRGRTVDVSALGVPAALEATPLLLHEARPVFEAGFAAEGSLVFADVLLPVEEGQTFRRGTADSQSADVQQAEVQQAEVQQTGGRARDPHGKTEPRAWRLVEVKSSTTVQDHQRDDVAVQAMVLCRAGLPLASVALARIDGAWVYPGGGDYRGLLVEEDVSGEAFARHDEALDWVRQAQAVAALPDAPARRTGRHCSEPHACGFMAHCAAQEPQTEFPLAWLPRVQSAELRAWMEQRSAEAAEGTPAADLRDVPDALLNDLQLRVKRHTVAGTAYFDAPAARAALAAHPLPALFLDFETVQFAVPVWPGTRPYQQIPFQFSLHHLAQNGTLVHEDFLDLGGDDPSRAFALALVRACSGDGSPAVPERATGPVFVYNAAFERGRIRELAQRWADLAAPLDALAARLVDLLPVVRQHYYHPSQQGSWSIKKVLPAICPDLDYARLDGVQDGSMAMDAFKEAIAPGTTPARRAEIAQQLTAYCRLDTLAMVRLWAFLSGRQEGA